ncbi:MAG: FeoB-associated Cys-rich membrane protein [Hungatella sp.]|nr:FeoB-associated Cys-rich membrane protein [Hungatella sp.]
MADLIIAALIATAMAAVIWKKIKDHKEGKSGCGCGCSGSCSNCSSRNHDSSPHIQIQNQNKNDPLPGRQLS